MRTLSSLKRQCLQPALSPNLRWEVSSWLGQLQGLGKGQNTHQRAHQGWICICFWMDFLRPIQTLLLPSTWSRERETANLLRNYVFLWMLMTKVLKQEKGMLLFLISHSEQYFILQMILLILPLVLTIKADFSGPTYRVRWAKVKGVAASCCIVL